jgi:hypothetical protein
MPSINGYAPRDVRQKVPPILHASRQLLPIEGASDGKPVRRETSPMRRAELMERW